MSLGVFQFISGSYSRYLWCEWSDSSMCLLCVLDFQFLSVVVFSFLTLYQIYFNLYSRNTLITMWWEVRTLSIKRQLCELIFTSCTDKQFRLIYIARLFVLGDAFQYLLHEGGNCYLRITALCAFFAHACSIHFLSCSIYNHMNMKSFPKLNCWSLMKLQPYHCQLWNPCSALILSSFHLQLMGMICLW